ncbi:replication protein A 70 kDa DNA-binding subunit B [Striga asiatica]|uniref:Replication protein A 70 kDa DNA-binding subunit B n=1 Tax=Striga asiatica TaxID=4170 RepID=A0A5A7R2V2_STRAF|nr:replication protein A 70 kDa DNA-binding subunit B [Striga asiatica]
MHSQFLVSTRVLGRLKRTVPEDMKEGLLHHNDEAKSTNWKLQANLLLESEVRLPGKELPAKRRVVRPVNGISSVNWRRPVKPTFRRPSFPTRPWSLHVTPFQEQSASEEVGAHPARNRFGFSSYPTSPPPLRRIHEAAGALTRWRNRTVFLCCWVVGILCTGMYSRERGKGGNDGPLDQPGSLKNKRQRSDALNRWRSKKNRASPMCQGSGSSPSLVPPQIGAPLFRTTSSDDALAEVTCVGATAVPTTAGSSVPEVLRPAAGSRLNDGRHLLGSVPSEPSILREQRCCQHCGAKKIAYETVKFCCSEGAIKLATHPIPDLLRDLLFSSSHESQLFRTCIRTINNQFAFTSLGVKYDQELSKRNRGVYTFRIQGQMYHFISDLESANNLQLYFHDTAHEVSNRLAACPRLTESITVKILKILESNPYAKFFRGLENLSNLDDCHIVLRAVPALDQRIYNQPTESEVAALWVDNGSNEETCRRDIQVHSRGGLSHKIQYYFGCYDPLQYPVLFPFGQIGWHEEDLIHREENVGSFVHEDPSFVSMREYYAYKLQIRTAWIQGTASLGAINQPLWFGACMNCRKKFELQVTSAILCSSCNKQSQISARARIPIKIEDGTGSIAAVVYGEDVELLTKFSGVQLQQADEKGEYILEKLDANMRGKHIVCFVRMFNVNGPSYSVVKLYKDKDQEDEPALIENEKETKQSLSGDKELLESQLFTPSAKACLEEVAAQILKTEVQGQPKASVRRVLNLENESSDSMGSTSALGNDYVPGTSGEGSGTNGENQSDSPLKKARTHT